MTNKPAAAASAAAPAPTASAAPIAVSVTAGSASDQTMDRKLPAEAESSGGGKLSRTRPGSSFKPFIEHPGESLRDQWLDARRFLTTFDTEKNAFALLQKRALRYPSRTALLWIDDDGNEALRWTFSELLNRVRGVARMLVQSEGLEKGDRVILCFAPGLEFFVGFWACLSVGVVAVPVAPPDPFSIMSDAAAKLQAISGDCAPKLVLSHREYITSLKMAAAAGRKNGVDFDPQRWRNTDDVMSLAAGRGWEFPIDVVSQSTLAFLQYTSGSTGTPKGVMVTHANLLSNCASCCRMTHALDTLETAMSCVTVSWLPTFHDMGLIGFHVTPLLAGGCVAVISPLTFVANPLVWLKVCSQFTRTITGAPPFALDMCINKCSTEALTAAGVDLSGLLVVFLGAAPILDSTLSLFAQKFRAFGFNPEVYAPSYGLAENVLFATGKSSNRVLPPRMYIDPDALHTKGVLTPVPNPNGNADTKTEVATATFSGGSAPKAQWMVSSGEVQRCKTNADPSLPALSDVIDIEGGTVVCVNPDTSEEVADGVCGEIWICGHSKAAGYWRREAATEETFGAALKKVVTARTKAYAERFHTFLRTGDMGAICNGQLYVTGRLKEMLIVNGANFYPSDLAEAIKLCHTAIRPGGTAAFAFDRIDVHGTAREAVGVVVELQPKAVTLSATAVSASGNLIGTNKNVHHVGGAGRSLRPRVTWTDWGKAKALRWYRAPGVERAVAALLPVVMTLYALFTALFQRLPPKAQMAARVLTTVGKGVARKAVAKFTKVAGAVASNADERLRFGYSEAEAMEIVAAVRSAVSRQFSVPLADVVLVPAKTVLKTSSGKLRHTETRNALHAGKFDETIIYRVLTPLPGSAGSGSTSATAAATPLAVNGLVSATPGGSLSSFRTVRPALRPTLRHPAASNSTHFDMKQPALKVSTGGSTPMSATLVTPTAYAARRHQQHLDTPRSAHPLKPPTEVMSRASPPAISEGERSASPSPSPSMAAAMAAVAGSAPLDVNAVKAAIRQALLAEFEPGAIPANFTDTTALDSLGVDSLRAMALTKKLSTHFSLPALSPFAFIADPTIEGVAKEVVRMHALARSTAGSPNTTLSNRAFAAAALREPIDPARLPHILGIGTAVPATGGPQAAVIPKMADIMGLSPEMKKKFVKIGNSSLIDTRYMVLNKLEDVFFGRTGLGNDEGIEPRNAVFKREAPKLALAAAVKAIDDWSGGDADRAERFKASITHVVAVTCTGVIIPGLEFEVMTALKLKEDTQRLGLVYMGCFGALSGLKTAKALAAESPRNRVLLVCCELCSLHMQMNDVLDNLIASALFSDGAGAVVVGCEPRTGDGERSIYECHHSASVVIPKTLEMMKWELSKTGMIIGLSKSIPHHIYGSMKPFVDELLGSAIKPADCAWAVHPGGPMIVNATMKVMGLPESEAQATWDVLRDYGNMSSATLLFVLDHLRKSGKLNRKYVPALAFGPGLNVEGLLLKASE